MGRMVVAIALAAFLSALAGQAAALSCMRPDPIGTFQQLAEAPEDYMVLYGRLTFDQAALPPAVSDTPDTDPAPIPAEFHGKGLTLDGFTADFAGPAVLQVTCAGPWCGSATSDVDAVYFVQAGQTRVVMQADPCGGMIFEKPSPELLEALTACIRGAECLPQTFK